MAKIKLTKTQIIIAVVAAVCAIIAVALGIYCVSTDQTPAQAAKSAFTPGEEKIIGKWQSKDKPGLSAFVFYEDGTYDSYISTVNFTGNYKIDGNKLTLENPSTNKTIVYKYTATEKELSLQVLEEEGEKSEDDTSSKYEKVDELNQKTLSDMLSELGGAQNTTEKTE